MATRIPVGFVVALLLASSSVAIGIGALLLLRPDWLGLALSQRTGKPKHPLDSFPSPSPWEELSEQLGHYTALVSQLQDSLHRVRSAADSLQRELYRMHEELLRWQRERHQREDSLHRAHYQAFAKIYNNAPPEDVAHVLAQLSPAEAGVLLRLMNPRQAARVMAALPPEQAAAVLQQKPAPEH